MFVIWWGVLFYLSSESDPAPYIPPIRFFDKVQHFGYFFGGGGLLSAFLYCLAPEKPHWRRMLLITVLVIAVVGTADEFHQSFTPGRSGNDPFDLTADVLGGLCGSLVFRRLHKVMER